MDETADDGPRTRDVRLGSCLTVSAMSGRSFSTCRQVDPESHRVTPLTAPGHTRPVAEQAPPNKQLINRPAPVRRRACARLDEFIAQSNVG